MSRHGFPEMTSQGTSGTLGPGLTCRTFQEYSRKYFINQLLLIGRIFNGIYLHMQLFVMFLFLFLEEYSRNMLQVRPRPYRRSNKWCNAIILPNFFFKFRKK